MKAAKLREAVEIALIDAILAGHKLHLRECTWGSINHVSVYEICYEEEYDPRSYRHITKVIFQWRTDPRQMQNWISRTPWRPLTSEEAKRLVDQNWSKHSFIGMAGKHYG